MYACMNCLYQISFPLHILPPKLCSIANTHRDQEGDLGDFISDQKGQTRKEISNQEYFISDQKRTDQEGDFKPGRRFHFRPERTDPKREFISDQEVDFRLGRRFHFRPESRPGKRFHFRLGRRFQTRREMI